MSDHVCEVLAKAASRIKDIRAQGYGATMTVEEMGIAIRVRRGAALIDAVVTYEDIKHARLNVLVLRLDQMLAKFEELRA